jgi:NitT/TauT family transport system substrate-binding protein
MFIRQFRGLRRTIAAPLFAAAVVGLPCSAASLERVTYLLPAPIFLPAFGPWIVSRQRGYYAAEGLEINFETARGGADVAKQIGVATR